jgi:hypothetical protein
MGRVERPLAIYDDRHEEMFRMVPISSGGFHASALEAKGATLTLAQARQMHAHLGNLLRVAATREGATS